MENRDLLLIARARRLSVTGEARKLREQAGLSLREVADAIGASPSALWRWENAQRTPRGAAAVAWGELLRDLDPVGAA
jgi:transcriptional regulator with XRE-family HTH domain